MTKALAYATTSSCAELSGRYAVFMPGRSVGSWNYLVQDDRVTDESGQERRVTAAISMRAL